MYGTMVSKRTLNESRNDMFEYTILRREKMRAGLKYCIEFQIFKWYTS